MLRLFITSTCLLLTCCGGDSGPTNVNLLIITVDTLRVDHLGTYGAERATPGIDLLADRGGRLRTGLERKLLDLAQPRHPDDRPTRTVPWGG
jgi:hypothetical protein